MVNGNNSFNETIVVSQQFGRFRRGICPEVPCGRFAVLPLEIRSRVSRRFLRRDAGSDAGGGRLPALSGKAKLRNRRPDGKPTRIKIDLCPEYIRHLPPKKRAVWNLAGRVFRSKALEKVFIERLKPGLKRRFGADFAKVAMYSVPILTRDVPGYYMTAHSDTLSKGITVQFYPPADNSTPV